jgi:hypothetical protein
MRDGRQLTLHVYRRSLLKIARRAWRKLLQICCSTAGNATAVVPFKVTSGIGLSDNGFQRVENAVSSVFFINVENNKLPGLSAPPLTVSNSVDHSIYQVRSNELPRSGAPQRLPWGDRGTHRVVVNSSGLAVG